MKRNGRRKEKSEKSGRDRLKKKGKWGMTEGNKGEVTARRGC